MKAQMGRTAFRAEGTMWNAYWAPHQNTMDGAILLGSIRLNAIQDNPGRKADFMRLMQSVVAEAITETTGRPVRWGAPHEPPENERGGNA